MKKTVKRIVLALLIVIGFIILAMIIIPTFFKSDLINLAKKEINKNVNAEVNFSDAGLNLFSNFPNVNFSLKDLSVVGKDDFKGDTLASFKNFGLVLDLFSLIGGKVNVIAFVVDEPNLHARINKEGKANWNITKPSEAKEVEESKKDTAKGKLNVALKYYAINKAHIIFENDSTNMYAEIKNITHQGKGNFTQDLFILETKTTADEVNLSLNDVKYVNKIKPDMKIDIEMDNKNSKYTFKDNYVKLNEFMFSIDGSVSMPDSNNIITDLNFKSNKPDFKTLLSLVPAIFKKNFDKVSSSGSLSFNGFVKGTYNKNTMPAFNLNLLVENGMFKYSDLPEGAKNINVDLIIDKKQGPADGTVIDLKKFHIEFANNPFDASFILKTPVSDPDIDVKMNGKVDFSNLTKIIPLEDVTKLQGIMNIGMAIKGKASFFEKEQYESINAQGNLEINGLEYASGNKTPISISKVSMAFNPQNIELKTFNAQMGKSDVQMTGYLKNFIPFALKKKAILAGSLNLTSKNIDFDEISGGSEQKKNVQDTKAEATELKVVEIPDNINFSLPVLIDKLKFDNLEYSPVNGVLKIHDKIAELSGVGTNKYFYVGALEGFIGLNGKYDTKDIKNPKIDFGMDIKELNIQKSAEHFVTVSSFAPVAKNASGKFSSNLKLDGALKQNMMPKYETINANGTLNLKNVLISNFKILTEIADKLEMDKYKELKIDNANIDFEIKNGKIYVKPFTQNVFGSKMTISGSNSLDQSIDYSVKMEIPSSQFGSNANELVGGLTNKINKIGLNVKLPNVIPVAFKITGTVDNPKVSPDFGGGSTSSTTTSATDQLKEETNKQIDEKKAELEKKAKEEIDKKKQELEAKQKELEKKAQEEADKKKKELEDKLKKDAKDKLKKLF